MHQVVILAGGLGTRVSQLTGGRLPKALLEVAGRPFIDRKLDELAIEGATEVLVLAGHGGDLLREHLDSCRPPVSVTVIEDGPGLRGTGGAVRAALPHLSDTFWLTYGDTFLTVPVAEAEEQLRAREGVALMTVLRNQDRVQPSNTTVVDGRVVAYRKGDPPGTHRWIDYGMLLFRRRVFEDLPEGFTGDLGVVLSPLVDRGVVLAFEVDEPFYDIGTPEALAETERHIRGGAESL